MEKTKIIEPYIISLRITGEDEFMKEWIHRFGDAVKTSPHFLYLLGFYRPVEDWMRFRGLDKYYITRPLMRCMQDLMRENQKNPIFIYSDCRINTGHKRAACMLFLGFDTIKAIVVPNNFKL